MTFNGGLPLVQLKIFSVSIMESESHCKIVSDGAVNSILVCYKMILFCGLISAVSALKFGEVGLVARKF